MGHAHTIKGSAEKQSGEGFLKHAENKTIETRIVQ